MKQITAEIRTNTLSKVKWQVILIISIFVASIPGFYFAPYSIFFFDEPYQILNSVDWKTSVYSPLSGWLGFLFGEISGWKFVSFRYLMITLNILSVMLTGLYAINRCRGKIWIIGISVLATYFFTIFRASFNLYGWDCWTNLFVVILLISILEYYYKPSRLKIVVMAIVGGMTVLLRAPNVCLLPIMTLIILGFRLFDKKEYPLADVFLFPGICLTTILLLMVLLYGSLPEYYTLLIDNSINSHPMGGVIGAFFEGFRNVMFFVVLFWILYLFLKTVNSNTTKIYIHAIVFLFVVSILFCVLIGSSEERLFNVNNYVSAIVTLGLFALWFIKWGIRRREIRVLSLTIFLIICISAIGSNNGYAKITSWPVLAVIYFLMEDKFGKYMKQFTILPAVSLFIYSFVGPPRYSFWDEGYSNLSYRVSGGVLDDVRTNQERGALIQEVYDNAQPYVAAGYDIIPIRYMNDYIWEYMFLKPNKYQRHTFDNDTALDDDKYVGEIREEISGTSRPILVMYMDSAQPQIPTKMLEMLDGTMHRELETPQYVFFTRAKEGGEVKIKN